MLTSHVPGSSQVSINERVSTMTLKSILSKALGHKRPAPLVVHQSIHLSPGMDAKAISRITESTIHEMIRGAR